MYICPKNEKNALMLRWCQLKKTTIFSLKVYMYLLIIHVLICHVFRYMVVLQRMTSYVRCLKHKTWPKKISNAAKIMLPSTTPHRWANSVSWLVLCWKIEAHVHILELKSFHYKWMHFSFIHVEQRQFYLVQTQNIRIPRIVFSLFG